MTKIGTLLALLVFASSFAAMSCFTFGARISAAHHAELDSQIITLEQASRTLGNLFEGPKAKIIVPPDLVLSEERYDAMDSADSRALYQKKLEYIQSAKDIIARMQKER